MFGERLLDILPFFWADCHVRRAMVYQDRELTVHHLTHTGTGA